MGSPPSNVEETCSSEPPGIGSMSANSSKRHSGIEIGQLLHAAADGNDAVLRHILAEGKVRVDEADYDGRTALHLACSEGRVEAVKVLLQAGADVNPKDRFGNTPLADAQSYGSAEICRLLKERGGLISESFRSPTQRPQILPRDDFEIDPADLEVDGRIGKGFFGDVRKAKWRGTWVAVKVFHDGNAKQTEEEFKEELRILQQLRHPNVVQFLGAVTKSEPHMLVTEYLSKGNLYMLLKKRGGLGPLEVLAYALDIARGMNYLHEHKPFPIVHRDLSTHNLLRDEARHLKVGDFGLKRVRLDTRSLCAREDSTKGSNAAIMNLAGTRSSYRYIAPEVFRVVGEDYDKSVDVFSFGIILHEMFEGLQHMKYGPEEVSLKYPDDKERPSFRSHAYPKGMKEASPLLLHAAHFPG